MPYDYEITAIVVSYNCLESLKISLKSLRDQRGVNHEIIVVDNDSSDGTVEYLRQSEVKAVFSDINIGYGRAANLGAGQASGEYLFVLNPDTEFSSSTLADLYDFARNSENIGVVSPLLRDPDGTVQLNSRNLPGRFAFFLGRGSPMFKLGITDESAAGYIRPMDNNPLEVPAVSATALFINKEVFSEIGGFDDRFFLYLEDIDFCKRVAERGLRIMLLPSVSVTHFWRGSSRKRRFFSIYHHHLSVWKYFRKHFPDERLYNTVLLAALVFGMITSSIFAVFKTGSEG